MIAEADDNGTRFESPGTVHKKLTFSEFCSGFYESEVEHKFVEYLKVCFRMCLYSYHPFALIYKPFQRGKPVNYTHSARSQT